MAYRIPQNLTFATSKTELYEMFVDYWSEYQTKNHGKVGLSFSTVDKFGKPCSLDQKEHFINAALKREILRTAHLDGLDEFPLETISSNPNVVWATFAIVNNLVDLVLPDTMIDSIGLYTEVRSGEFGDSFLFDVKPRDLFVVSKSGRGKRVGELQNSFNSKVSLTPEPRMISVYVSLYRVLAGHESLAEFVMKAIRSMETEMTRDVYASWTAAFTALPTTPADGELKFAGYSQESLIKLAQRVTAWNNGQKAVFVGTQLALQNILPTDANYRYMLDSEYVKIGYLPTAFGFDCMILPQVADWKTNFKTLIDDTRIYVISPSGGKPVKLCLEGSTISNTTGNFDSATLTQSATLMKSWKAGVVASSIAGLITLS